MSPHTVAQALSFAQQRGVHRSDGQWMLLHLMNPPLSDRAWLITHEHTQLTETQWATWSDWVEQRINGVPVAYLTGKKAFYGLELLINDQVLDPRPDTETLVDWALQLLSDQAHPKVLDLGTGSGAIALALAHHAPHAQVHACDRSESALRTARANAERLALQVHFLQSDWFSKVQGQFDLIVSNPPYIAEGDPHLAQLIHEPREALVAGVDGLSDLRHLIDHSGLHLNPGGWLMLEHGHDQAPSVRALFESKGFVQVQSRRDLNGIERCSAGQWRVVE